MTQKEKTQDRSSVKGFGAKLKAEREAREVSLEEISRVSRISLHLLKAMEEDRWEELPGGIFTRNFIRLYANHLGLEAEKLVDEFRRFIDIKTQAETEREDIQKQQREHEEEADYTWMYIALVGTIVLLIGGFFLVNSFSGNESPQVNDAGAVQQAATELPAEGVADESAGGETSGSAILTENQESGITIELVETSRGQTWFQWRADGELQSPPDGENLFRNQPRTFRADEAMWFNITRLQSITLHVNGEKREWSEFDPQPRTNEDGATISYIVEITEEDLD